MGSISCIHTLHLLNVNNICNIFGIEQLVQKITRPSVDTTSCIDLCFTNFPEKHLVTDVININFSDHFLFYSVLDLKMCKVASKVIKRRSYNNFSVDRFLHDISNSILCGFDPHVYNNVEEAWNVWYTEGMLPYVTIWLNQGAVLGFQEILAFLN